MTPDQLSRELSAAALEPGALVYLERRGDEYRWERGQVPAPDLLPDAWMYYGGDWPEGGSERWEAFFDDLIAELDTMAIGGDRCRWPLDQPYPHGH